MAIFPPANALISVLGVLNRADQAVDTVLEVMRPLVSAQALADLDPVLRDLAGAPSAGLALFLGVAVAPWSASAYINASGHAMNRILEVKEGRPLWKHGRTARSGGVMGAGEDYGDRPDLLNRLRAYLTSPREERTAAPACPPVIFIVHGHDLAFRDEVATAGCAGHPGGHRPAPLRVARPDH